MKIKLLFIVLIFFILESTQLNAQTKGLSNFYGNSQMGEDICVRSGNFTNDVSVERLVAQIVEKFGTKNAFLIIPCDRTPNAQATIDQNGKPYILYNPEFLKSVKSLNFTTTSLPSNITNWETITVLAHEIAHHLNFHLINPHPDATFRSMELEADETAGFILFKLGATLDESQRAMRSASESIEGSYTHPPRAQRLEAIRKGWEKAKSANPAPTPVANKMNDIDGNQYDVIKIGTTSWAQKNLDVTKFRNGDIIKNASSDKDWEEAGRNGQPAWCYYDNDSENGKIYGKLYNWYAVKDTRGLCPRGWHVPGDLEWTALTNDLGGKNTAGGKMKSIDTTAWNSPNAGATNESGFSGLPGGYRNYVGSFLNIRSYAFFWSAAEFDYYESLAIYRDLYNFSGNVAREYLKESFGASVRCLRD
jgi:uncharacterized protein (TIGR02145 family)